jgi:DNA-binding NarL/FixJ family response regulator
MPSAAEKLRGWGCSGREVDVFLVKRRGAKIDVVADELGISPRTADTHLRSLYRRLGVHGLIEVETMLREGPVGLVSSGGPARTGRLR